MSVNILVVDDSNSIRKMVEFTLKTKNYNVVTACNGKEGLEELSKLDYQLIILDINMPQVDGFKFLEVAKGEDAYKNIPVVMLTTEGQDEDREKALKLGAENYMVKPFKPTELIEKVHRILSNEK